MTDEPLKPKRRRRRWLIATLAVVVALSGWWVVARSADSRFVGTWKWEVLPDAQLGAPVPFVIRIEANGRATVHESTGNAGQFVDHHLAWWVENDDLVLRKLSGSAIVDMRDYIRHAFSEAIGGVDPFYDVRWMIVHVENDTIALQSQPLPKRRELTLTRILTE